MTRRDLLIDAATVTPRTRDWVVARSRFTTSLQDFDRFEQSYRGDNLAAAYRDHLFGLIGECDRQARGEAVDEVPLERACVAFAGGGR